MRNFLIRLVLNTLALFVLVQIYGGVSFAPNSGLTEYLVAGLILGLVNALVRPILLILTLPLNLLTLGLFTLIINGIVLSIVAGTTALNVAGFGGAVVGALLLTVISYLLNALFSDRR
jgi:putative membrane protein